ncbi:MAG: GGDEF domain-containing protein [Gallionella sp.]|nr:GGDEF domain-containing protein [Gallionella sp.]
MTDLRKQTTTSGLQGVLKTLGTMTAIRDTYLVEQSLLRTLGPLLGVLETSLYRVDDNGGILRSLNYSRMVVTEGSGTHRVKERVEEVTNDRNIPKDVMELLDSVRMLGKPSSRKVGNDWLICYPLRGGGVLRGFFVFQRDCGTTPVEDSIINGTLDVFSNYYELLDTSQRDQLTGLFNRYSLEINLDRLWNLLSAQMREKASNHEDSQRTEIPHTFWLGVIDVDHFKKINDTYGHIIGDEVLIMVSRLLERSFRQSDLLYRYGGEEFIAIIAANDLDAATRAFDRARDTLAQFEFPQVGHVTISIGFSGADPSVLPQEVISRADSSLYAAKNAGRNRVCHYDTLVKEGVLKEVASGSIDLF